MIVFILIVLLAACTSLPAPTQVPVPPTASISLPDAITDQPKTAVPALITAERAATIAGDLAALAELWAVDAHIVDGRGTDATGDDYVWQGRDAIMDRYELAVLPALPPAMDPALLDTLTVTAEQDTAHAEMGIDRWTLTWRDGRWWLFELRYN